MSQAALVYGTPMSPRAARQAVGALERGEPLVRKGRSLMQGAAVIRRVAWCRPGMSWESTDCLCVCHYDRAGLPFGTRRACNDELCGVA